jgi:hypothetical protein
MSYQCTILAPYHKNERKNLLDKLYDGAANVERHHAKFPSVAYKALLVRIPDGASVAACSEWAREFYRGRIETSVDFIFLYTTVRSFPNEPTRSV